MNFLIEVSKTFIPVGGTIGGVILGFFLSRWVESRRERNKLESMRMLLSDEMISNYMGLITNMPPKGGEHLLKGKELSFARNLTLLSFVAYNNYLGYIYGLKKDEIKAINRAYRSTLSAVRVGDNVLSSGVGEKTKDYLLEGVQGTLNNIEKAVLLIDSERETLDDLEELRGRAIMEARYKEMAKQWSETKDAEAHNKEVGS